MIKGKWVTIPSSNESHYKKGFEKGLKSKLKYVVTLNGALGCVQIARRSRRKGR